MGSYNRTYTYTQMEAAVCLWEHVLEILETPNAGDNDDGPLVVLRENIGTSCLRHEVMKLAVTVDEAFKLAESNDWPFDEPFDWEFVPKFMSECVDIETHTLIVRPNWRELVSAFKPSTCKGIVTCSNYHLTLKARPLTKSKRPKQSEYCGMLRTASRPGTLTGLSEITTATQGALLSSLTKGFRPMTTTLMIRKTPTRTPKGLHFKQPIKGIIAKRYYGHDGSLSGELLTLGSNDLQWFEGVFDSHPDDKDLKTVITYLKEGHTIDLWLE